MSNLIDELSVENESYFRGKELEFDNDAEYTQCIADPDTEDGFIAVLNRHKKHARQAKMTAWKLKEEK